MTIRNEQGQVMVFYVLLVPFFILLLIVTMEFSRLVATKMKLQGSLDRGIFKGAEYLTQVLNQTAQANRQAHEIFLATQKRFRKDSKQNIPSAKSLIQNTWRQQNDILDEKVTPLIEKAYQEAYRIVEREVQIDFPTAEVLPFYYRPIQILDGRIEKLPFDRMEGITFDPKGHSHVAKKDFEARIAFSKKTGPQERTALAAGVELPITQSLLPFLIPKRPMRAVSTAQPHGGSIWAYALTKKDSHLYQTTFVPLKNLPPQGFVNFWQDISPYEIDH